MTEHRPTIASLHGIVAAAHPLAASAGARILAQGGNAFDAAAAVGAALNVVEPFMSGLAGLGLATMWVAAEKRVRVLDFVPLVPASFPVDRFNARQDLERGALAVSSPGNLAGWCELAGTYGRLPLADLFRPAVEIASGGFALLSYGASEFTAQAKVMRAWPDLYPNWASVYERPVDPVPVGTVLRQPDLAETLRAIGEAGPAHLYNGSLGERVVAHIRACGGTLTMEDLGAVRPRWVEPIFASYRGLLIHMPPPPCESFQILLALRILEGMDLAGLPRNGVDHLDIVYRAIRLAAGKRIANNNPGVEQLAHMLSDAEVDALRARMRDGMPIEGPTEQWQPAPDQTPKAFNTTSFSIADREGNLVCVTQSLGSAFGSGLVVPGTGLCLNNFLYWADVQSDSPNLTLPGADLPICMAPSIALRDGSPVLALGTPGSYGILQTQVQALVQYVDFGLPLQHAIEAPRGRLMDGRTVTIEDRIDAGVIAGLCARGHDAAAFGMDWTMKVGGMQAVSVDPATSVMTGAADPRRDGHVAVP